MMSKSWQNNVNIMSKLCKNNVKMMSNDIKMMSEFGLAQTPV